MEGFNHYIVPSIVAVFLLYGLLQNVPVFDVFLEGAKEGLSTAVRILPSLVGLITAVGVFKASGALDLLSHGLKPAAQFLGLPTEVMPLALLRPVSGSGGMAVFRDLLDSHGPDSFVGRVASVMMGSTETTFYTIAVYYGAIDVRKTRHTLPAALGADLAGFVFSSLAVLWLFGQ
ncbi:MAG: spore maturation protein [Oscillospiraceae bacterium]|nr:spore maturation protein [Oscillospiraceae bacterium]